jgi:hypothetical protein
VIYRSHQKFRKTTGAAKPENVTMIVFYPELLLSKCSAFIMVVLDPVKLVTLITLKKEESLDAVTEALTSVSAPDSLVNYI